MTYALLFDFDGVLVDSTPAYRAAWSEWARTYGANEAHIWADATDGDLMTSFVASRLTLTSQKRC